MQRMVYGTRQQHNSTPNTDTTYSLSYHHTNARFCKHGSSSSRISRPTCLPPTPRTYCTPYPTILILLLILIPIHVIQQARLNNTTHCSPSFLIVHLFNPDHITNTHSQCLRVSLPTTTPKPRAGPPSAPMFMFS